MDLETLARGAADGDEAATEALMTATYDELRALARRAFLAGRSQTLQATALVHEVFVKLAHRPDDTWRGREHFLATAALCMRQILIDHARRRRAQKRGGDAVRVTLSGLAAEAPSTVDLIELDDVLSRLEAENPRHARLAVMRIFGELTVPQIATVLGVSPRTVDNDWRYVRAWLRRQLRA